jgi:hypothetical protein
MELDTRGQLRRALQQLAAQRLGMACGLEVEFHVYRLAHPDGQDALDPHAAQWPGPAPAVHMLHGGYHLLSEASLDQCDAMLAIVRRCAQALDLPLSSLEIEIGPSQFEAVFDVSDALTAADHMVLFRSAVRQALRRAGHPGLDAVLRQQLVPAAQARREGPISAPLATHRVVAALRGVLHDQPLRDLQSHIDQGRPFDFGADSLGPCFQPAVSADRTAPPAYKPVAGALQQQDCLLI